ncbi:paramyosin-like [Planococcus citri]|uniref:paramyosin-like n=1 Tax=Planococcus citri TaxID=170843 RepID=UPI0031F8C330
MDNSSEDFQQKLRSWFQNKGIIDKLVLYLRSQMFIELQNHSKETIGADENNSVSPKLQAVKLLIADFLLRENLLFALSVFCSEVPVLSNFKRYTNYISHLASITSSSSKNSKQLKPKFTSSDVHDILEALGLRLTKDEISVVHKMYKSDKFNSLLFCLLYLLPTLLKRNRHLQRILVKVKKKDRYFRRVIRSEKTKVNRMYSLIQNAYDVVLNHKTELNLALQKQNELLERETILNDKEEYLISKERDFENYYQAKIKEVEKKTATIAEKDHELLEKYKKLSEEQDALNSEKLLWVEKTGQMYSERTYETVKLQEYEQKFRTLQTEVFEILKQCRQAQDKRNVEVDKAVNKEIQCRFDIINQSQQTESNDTLNLEEYVNLMEKENALLKSGSFKQRQYIAQLTTEIVFLKNRLDYLEKDLQIKAQFERRKEMNEVAEKLYSPRSTLFDRPKSVSTTSNFKINRRLFPEKEFPSSSDPTSSTSKDDTSLTDELVNEAKNKLEQLENESEALNKNFKHLQTVLSKNISFSDETSQSSSPIDKLRRKYTALSPRFSNSNLSDSDLDLKNSTSFKKMYWRYKQNKRKEKPVDGDELKPTIDERIQADNESSSNDRIMLAKKLAENLNIEDPEIEKKESDRSEANMENEDRDGEISKKDHEIQNITKQLSNLHDSSVTKSSDSNTKQEGELSAALKDSENSSDFWK